MKLQVGKDYIDEVGQTIHIDKFSSVTGHYHSTQSGTEYLNDGKIANDSFDKRSSNGAYKLLFEAWPFVKPEPTKEQILEGLQTWYVTNKSFAHEESAWIAAIKWYKQFKANNS